MPFGKGETCVRVCVEKGGGAGLVGGFCNICVRIVLKRKKDKATESRAAPNQPTNQPTNQPPTIDQSHTQGYDEYWVLEVHYNNPEEEAGLHDATGMEARAPFWFCSCVDISMPMSVYGSMNK